MVVCLCMTNGRCRYSACCWWTGLEREIPPSLAGKRGEEGMACARTHNHTHFTNRATKRAPSVGRPPGETRVKIPRKTLTPR